MKQRIFTLLLAALLLFSSCGVETLDSGSSAAEAAPQRQEQDMSTLRIAYNSGDSMNPYEAKGLINRNVASLIYDPLVKLDGRFSRHLALAEEVRCLGLTCTVRLKAGAVFSDGTPVTAEDVVYSVQQARGSTFSGLVANVEKVEAAEDGSVVFTLLAQDAYFPNLLTFPIVSRGSPDLGSGRYRLASGGESPRLESNPRWQGGSTERIQTIELVNQMDKETLIYSLKLGTINYIYSDFSDSEALGTGTVPVNLNNLVYLGVNSGRAALGDHRMRQALSLALNRNQLADATYAGYAKAAGMPFHPDAEDFSVPASYLQQDKARAEALLAELGYQKGSDGYYAAGQGRLHLKLLVNEDNEGRMQVARELQKDYRELGLEIELDARPFEEYQRALEQWDFDLYLGEVKLYPNMDLSAMLSPGAKLGFGVAENEALLAAHRAFRAGESDVEAFCSAFAEQTPFLPLMYRCGVVAFSRDVYYDVQATEQDIFYNISSW